MHSAGAVWVGAGALAAGAARRKLRVGWCQQAPLHLPSHLLWPSGSSGSATCLHRPLVVIGLSGFLGAWRVFGSGRWPHASVSLLASSAMLWCPPRCESEGSILHSFNFQHLHPLRRRCIYVGGCGRAVRTTHASQSKGSRQARTHRLPSRRVCWPRRSFLEPSRYVVVSARFAQGDERSPTCCHRVCGVLRAQALARGERTTMRLLHRASPVEASRLELGRGEQHAICDTIATGVIGGMRALMGWGAGGWVCIASRGSAALIVGDELGKASKAHGSACDSRAHLRRWRRRSLWLVVGARFSPSLAFPCGSCVSSRGGGLG